ncbi:MAG: ABC transporter ATP-binding protein [Elusimicrobiota bacterium]
MKIEIANLSKKIGSAKVLKNINLLFESGSTNVIVGPNGAGKTSLLRQIALLDKICNGDIFFDNQSVLKMSAQTKLHLRRRIGFVFQTPVILSGTVYDNLVYGLRVSKKKIYKNEIDTILTKVGLSKKNQQYAKTLSGGEKQQLSLARVLVLHPEVYIFDEPTVNLDPGSVKVIENTISELSKLKKTIVLTTHNLRQARKFGQKIFFMNNGKIIQKGTVDEVFNQPISVDIAEYSFAENIFNGKITTENGQKYFLSNGIKMNVVADDNISEVSAVLHAEDIFVSRMPFKSSARNCFNGKIKKIENIGAVYNLVVDVAGTDFETVITKQSLVSMNLKTGDEIYLTFKATSVHLIKNS